MAAGPEAVEAGRRLQQDLLFVTVEQARRQSSYYRTALPPAESHLSIDEFLPRLPVLTRRDLLNAGERLRSQAADYGFSSYTSGTTEVPIVIDRSTQEQKYLSALFRELSRDEPLTQPTLALIAASWHHGHQIQLEGRVKTFPVALNATPGYVIAEQLLSREYPIDGRPRSITTVAGATNRILQLTAYLSARGFDPGLVTQVSVSGQYLDRKSRDLLASFWRDARVQDRYSLTEMFGGAEHCVDCHQFHFGPFVIPEVLDRNTLEALPSGRGLLCLTALYPFTQMTPLIRYLPGDLAELSTDRCSSGRKSFAILGRATQLLRIGSGRPISQAELIDVLVGIPGVGRDPDPAPIPAECAYVSSLPKYQITAGSDGLVVEAEASSSPQQGQELQRRIASALAELVELPATPETVDVRVVSRGSLGREWRSRV